MQRMVCKAMPVDPHTLCHCGKLENGTMTIFSSPPYPLVTGDTPMVLQRPIPSSMNARPV